jgi:signal transduction histidine kinase
LRSPAGRRPVQLLRAELIRAWSERQGTADSADILASFSMLQKLDEAVDPLDTLHALAPLTGAAGPELVVEVAHDLRSPVTSILFLSETIQSGRSGEVNDLQRRQLGLIYSAALGLSTVASDLIELAQGGDRLMERKPVPFSVAEIFEAVRDITRPIAEEKHLTVQLNPPATDYRLGYPMALSRVLLNLTTNALKFTEEGRVEIAGRGIGWTKVEFSVQDTGPGVRPESLESLYQPFRRASGRKGFQFSGTGLGLTICRRLLKAMGSELKVETEQDRGTRFFFEIDIPPTALV